MSREIAVFKCWEFIFCPVLNNRTVRFRVTAKGTENAVRGDLFKAGRKVVKVNRRR